jgi:hypothetical protein
MDTKDCVKCNSTLPLTEENFYRIKNGTRKGKWQAYCKPCNLQDTINRQRAFKQRCVDYKGGKCEHCGFNKSNVALDFHHTDPTQKDFSIAHVRNTSYEKNKEKIESELDKCLLLCRNCHALEHERLNK